MNSQFLSVDFSTASTCESHWLGQCRTDLNRRLTVLSEFIECWQHSLRIRSVPLTA